MAVTVTPRGWEHVHSFQTPTARLKSIEAHLGLHRRALTGAGAGAGGLPRLSIVQNVAQGRGSTAGGQARLWKVLPRQELEQSRAESLQAV